MNSSFFSQVQAHARDGKIKILVLIIDSDNLPVYAKLREIWRAYMYLDSEHVVAYFIRGDENLPTNYIIKNDTLWTKTKESVIPGVLNKTILSMEYMLPQTKQADFDYILRTNLSAFFVFPRLLDFLNTCPKKNFYCGANGIYNKITYCSGSGLLLSRDLAELLVEQKTQLKNERFCDDVEIGDFFANRGIKMACHKRMHFPTLQEWKNGKDKIPSDIFQFRANNDPKLRISDEIYIDSQLLKMFYNKFIYD